MREPNQVLIFDLFGVIAKPQNQRGRKALEAEANVDSKRFWAAYWDSRPAYDRGELRGTDYWAVVAERLHVSFSRNRIQRLIDHDIASWSQVDDQMVELVEQLAGHHRLALLSNIPYESGEVFLNRHRWLDLFEVRALSYQIGYAKPEADAYAWCLRELGIEGPAARFIDDRRENVEAAEQAGLVGHLFTSQQELRRTLGMDLN
ncbi:haloacid dehalogenase (plasmid) [Arthrobacter sp. StoSoilB3]|nr:haloacid dehalogenase [Arthrobacter sp. StoSoilB3]